MKFISHVFASADAGRVPDLQGLPSWDLSDLYDGIDSPKLREDLDQAAVDAGDFEQKFKGNLSQLAQQGSALAAAVAAYESLDDQLTRMASFAQLVYAGDTANPANAKFYGDMVESLTNISTQLLFFQLELNQLSDEEIAAALAAPELAYYRPWLEDIRREKPFQLADKLEQLFHEKSLTGASAWNRLFDETMTALKFDVDGEELALEPTLNLLQDHNGETRKKAALALGSTLDANLRTFTLITNTLAKDKEISDRWRGFEDIADSRHLANRVEREVVDALTDAVSAAYPRLSHRYYQMKAKWLGMDQLNYWDRNAPLPDEDDRLIGWPDAQKIVLDAYGGFSGRLRDLATPFFENGWIDAAMRPGKSPGAFAHPTSTSVHPYLLLNYQGKPRDVMTLAHELGHGVHQRLAAAQGPLMAPTPLTLAETASVFGEMLTFQAMLNRAENPTQRRVMIASKVEDMINTVVRQIAFYQFERRVHTARREGELTSDQMNEIWLSVQGESLGPAIKLEPSYGSFWAYVPHFIHTPFYVYAYAFGDCLVNSLYAVFEQADEGFQDKYFDLLAAGGSRPYQELLEPFGLNAKDPEFWNMGLGMIERLIDELDN